MPKVLVTFSKDWADEFQCEQFVIAESEDQASRWIADVVENGAYFGTNEGWEAGEIEADDFQLTEITDQEAKTLIRLLGSNFGTGAL